MSYEGIPTKTPQSPFAEVTLRQCLTTLCDCLVYFNNGNFIKNTTFMAYNLLESSQSSELSINIGFPANMFSKSTSCVIATGGELSDTLFFIKPYETQNLCIYLLSHNFLHLAQSLYIRHTNYR